MIRISTRDIFADLPKNLLKKKMKEVSERIPNPIDFQDYNDEVIEKLRILYEEGKIESHPSNMADLDPYGNYSEASDPEHPAYIWEEGDNGDEQPHRGNDLPAEVWCDGSKIWRVHGQEHRENNQPSAIYADGSKRWCYKNELHREDGPAYIGRKADEEYYLDGTAYTKESYEEFTPEERRARRPS